jgi:hypothetical protein
MKKSSTQIFSLISHKIEEVGEEAGDLVFT